MIYKYMLLFYRLPFHSVDSVFWCTKVLDLDVLQFLYIFSIVTYDYGITVYKKSLPNLMSWSFFLMISSKSFIV